MSTGSSDDVINATEAADILGIGEEQLSAMVEEGMLEATRTGDGERGFVRANVEAVRLQGG